MEQTTSDPGEISLASRAQASQLAATIIEGTTEKERSQIIEWLRSLKEIAESTASIFVKSRKAIEETLKSEVIWPSIKMMGAEIKRRAWDDRSIAFRLSGGAVIATLTLVGGEAGAGIVALGGGVGVPLWIVFGSGAAFAGTLLEEIVRASTSFNEPSVSDEKYGSGGSEKNPNESSILTVSEAFKVLGLQSEATEEDVLLAYRRLISRVHPDVGGSAYMAAQLDHARDILLAHLSAKN